MSDKQQAAADLKRLAVMFKGIIALADDLDTLGSMEQAEKEAKSRLDKMQADEAAAQARVDGFDAAYEKKQDAAKDRSDRLIADAQGVRDKADQDAAQIIADADAKASKIIAGAEDRRKSIEAQNAARTDELQATTAAAAAAQAKLDEINKQLDSVRKKISA